jgi:hypothetical protein
VFWVKYLMDNWGRNLSLARAMEASAISGFKISTATPRLFCKAVLMHSSRERVLSFVCEKAPTVNPHSKKNMRVFFIFNIPYLLGLVLSGFRL